MTSQYRHRRTSIPSAPFPTPIEPGEIAVNTANRQIAVGDAASASIGAPKPLIAIRYFDAAAQYVANDYVQNGTNIYRANKATGPGGFIAADWVMMVGAIDPQYVAKAGDTMTGPLAVPVGTVTATGLHFGTPGTGFWTSAAATQINVSLGGTNRIALSTTALTTLLPIIGSATGTAAAPSYSFVGDLVSGFYRKAANSVSVAANSLEVMNWNATNKLTTAYGAVALPADPVNPLEATTKQYVDAKVLNKAAVYVSDSPPAGVPDNSLWMESDTGIQYWRYNDGNSSQWVMVSQGPADAVRYGGAQALTSAQRSQARSNIDVTKKNYIINGAMMISQENGSTIGAAGVTYFPVDQFTYAASVAGFSLQQMAVTTPGGSPNRMRIAVTTTHGSVAAGDLVILTTRLEGLRVADLLSGTALAKTVTLQFGVRSLAGTYCVAFHNNDGTRSYVSSFTISAGEAGADVIKTITLPLDVTGTWKVDNTIGIDVTWCLLAGATYQTGSPNTWTSTASVTAYATATQTNWLANAPGALFELFDVSLTEGTVAPPFQVPKYADELWECQRYYESIVSNYNSFATGYCETAANVYAMVPYKREKRASPTVTTVPFGAFSIRSGFTQVMCTAVSVPEASPSWCLVGLTFPSNLSVGFGVLCMMSPNNPIKVSARL